MSQRLILPFADMRVTASYKNEQYRSYWGFDHYGMDCISTGTAVHACGNGKVIACGQDGTTLYGNLARLGNVIVIVYEDVALHDGTVSGLACRMYHFDKIYVQTGDSVTQDTVIGEYGNTGRYSSGPHLHIEFDTDTQWPCYAYGVASGGRIIKSGTIQSTKDPNDLWYVGKGQKISGSVNGWYRPEDLIVPALPDDSDQPGYQELYEQEKKRADEAQAKAEACSTKYKALLDELESLHDKYD